MMKGIPFLIKRVGRESGETGNRSLSDSRILKQKMKNTYPYKHLETTAILTLKSRKLHMNWNMLMAIGIVIPVKICILMLLVMQFI